MIGEIFFLALAVCAPLWIIASKLEHIEAYLSQMIHNDDDEKGGAE